MTTLSLDDTLMTDVTRAMASMDINNRDHKILAQCMVKLLGRISQQEQFTQELHKENKKLKSKLRRSKSEPKPVEYQLQTCKILSVKKSKRVSFNL